MKIKPLLLCQLQWSSYRMCRGWQFTGRAGKRESCLFHSIYAGPLADPATHQAYFLSSGTLFPWVYQWLPPSLLQIFAQKLLFSVRFSRTTLFTLPHSLHHPFPCWIFFSLVLITVLTCCVFLLVYCLSLYIYMNLSSMRAQICLFCSLMCLWYPEE